MVNVLLPQIYNLDKQGRKVLVGLTYEKTIEFAVLDAVPPNVQFNSMASGNIRFPTSRGAMVGTVFQTSGGL
jgi:hypothetical protein